MGLLFGYICYTDNPSGQPVENLLYYEALGLLGLIITRTSQAHT